MVFGNFLAIFLHTAGLVAFGGGLLWFVLLFLRADRAQGAEGSRLADDSFRITSLGMSVGLTFLIAGGLLRHYLTHGSFRWSTSTVHDTLNLIKILVFLVEWVAWGWFEVVVMHRFRVDVPQPGAQPSEGYAVARARVRRALRIQLALFSLVLLLGAAAQAARSR